MKLFDFSYRRFLSFFLVTGVSVFIMIPSLALAVACRDIASVQTSADATKNTGMGGHVTQHIYGMRPPAGTSQNGKTLFESKGDYDAAWRQYQYITNPINCSGSQAQQSVSLHDLGMTNLGAYSCKAADANGECTSWDAYIAKSVFFGFLLKNSQWILNTSFPEPLL